MFTWYYILHIESLDPTNNVWFDPIPIASIYMSKVTKKLSIRGQIHNVLIFLLLFSFTLSIVYIKESSMKISHEDEDEAHGGVYIHILYS